MSAQPTHDDVEVRLFDEHDIARMFNLPGGKTYVLEKCREQEWPHLKFSARVIRFADESGRARFARHVVRRSPTTLGTIGQVQYDRRRPDQVLSFTSARPPFAEHPRRPNQR